MDPIQQLIALLDNSSPNESTIIGYVGDVLSALGLIVGLFNHQFGIDLQTTPQAVVLGVSLAVLLGLNAFRLLTKAKVSTAKAAAVETIAYHYKDIYGIPVPASPMPASPGTSPSPAT